MLHKLALALSLALAWLGVAKADVPAPTPRDVLAAKIADALIARFPVQGRYHVDFADPAPGLAAPAALTALTYDAARQSFAAAATIGTAQVTFAGSAYAVIDVPALARDLDPGEAIAAEDIVSIELPAQRAGANLVTSAETLAGQVARRPIRARAPLYAFDVKKAALVKKGDPVTITFALPGLELTAAGQAQADGALGDIVSVLNTRSRRTIEARVTGTGTVSVQPHAATLASAQR